MNPFDLTGHEFLGLYAVLFVMVVPLAIYLRRQLRQPADDPPEGIVELNPYEIAYLAGGPNRALNAILTSLVHRNHLKAEPTDRKLHVAAPLSGTVMEVERQVYEKIASRGLVTLKEIHGQLTSAVDDLANRPREMGLLVSVEQAWSARWGPTLIVLGLAMLGVGKIVVGLSRDKPVAFLVIGTIITAFVALVGFARPILRSRRGDLALDRLKAHYAALQTQATANPATLSAADVSLALGLFGLGVLAAGPLADLRSILAPPGASSCGSGCGSGCGGGGGGDGGGGGGCGGCGGGGGGD